MNNRDSGGYGGRRGRRRRDRDFPFFDFLRDFFPFGGGDAPFNQFDEAIEHLINSAIRSTDRKGKWQGPYVWGFRITKDPEGRPQIQRFGNVKAPLLMGKDDDRTQGDREPLIDVLDADDIFRVIAEMPGVSKEDISLHATEDALFIEAESAEKKLKYRKKIDIPMPVDPEITKAKFKNGVLEVELTKKEEDELKGTEITIED